MKTMEELRKKAIAKWKEFFARGDTSPAQDAEDLIDYMIENFLRENQPETAEPKPRWKDRTDGDTYTVRKLDDSWVIFFDPNNSEESRRTDNKQMARVFFTEQKANTCLDNCLGSSPNWERCEEEEESKPRWRARTDGDTYAVREMDDGWEIWFTSDHNECGHQSMYSGISGTFPSEQKAIDALDKWCMEVSDWERCDEKEEPKPRWHACEGEYTYTVRELDDGWVIWYNATDGESEQSKDLETRGLYAEEQEAVDALDKRCESLSQWERCDEEEESFDEVLAEILKLREQLGLGDIYGIADGLWGILNDDLSGIDIGAYHTFPELRDILRKRAEPVTREQLKESVDYLHDETSNDHVAHRHYDRAKRFIGELRSNERKNSDV